MIETQVDGISKYTKWYILPVSADPIHNAMKLTVVNQQAGVSAPYFVYETAASTAPSPLHRRDHFQFLIRRYVFQQEKPG